MKKIIFIIFLIFSLGAGLPPAQILAASEAVSKTTGENAELTWQKALKTQVSLAHAKLSLIQAHADLQLEKDKAVILHSLDDTRTNLDEALRSADQVTRARIIELKLQVDLAKKFLKEKGWEAEVELNALANESESVLNAALVQVQVREAALRDEASTRYALIQAKAAALNALIAFEIDKSSEKTQQALQDVESYLQQAKESACEATTEQVVQLQDLVQAAQKAVCEDAEKAKFSINTLVMFTERSIQSYEKTIQESEEAKLLQKRYGQLEAKVALLKANQAANVDATGKKVVAYLNESKAWYNSLKSKASLRLNKELTEMSTRIDEAKQAVKRKDKETRARLAELLERAAAMLKDEEPDK